jgi:hypothetical protein
MGEFKPYPKSKQLAGHQKPKDTPKFKAKRTYKKKSKPRQPLKPEIYKGRNIPQAKQRGRVTTKEYNEALRQHGEHCYYCGSPYIEMHHVMPKGFSKVKMGRGKWRNLRGLCHIHHRSEKGVEHNPEMMAELQQLHEELYGPYYWCDEYDLFKMGLIPNTTEEAYEKFFLEVENGEQSRLDGVAKECN